MNVSPKISLIFVNYRSAQYLQRALASLLAFEREGDLFEIIVVNNDVEESAALRELKGIYDFLLVESGSNMGFGRGNNLGVRASHGEVLAFINPDVLWTGAHLESIARIFQMNAAVGVVGMALLDENEEPEAWSAGQAPSLLCLVRNNLIGPRQAFAGDHGLFPVDWVSGGGLCIRKNIFSAIGGFDERFFLYFEDVDLCAEVRRRGLAVVRCADLPLIHFGGKSRHSARIQKKHFYASQKQYFEKWRPRWERITLKWLQFFFCRK